MVDDTNSQGGPAPPASELVDLPRTHEIAGEGTPSGEVSERAARAAYVALDLLAAIAAWERAYGAYRRAGDHVGAVRVARTLAYMYGSVVGDAAIMSGWLARAQTLLGASMGTLEGGWVSLQVGMFEGDRARKEERLSDALARARRFGDTDLELVSLAYLGASIVHDDRTEEGMVLLDEALAGVAGGEVDDVIMLGEIFCQLFSACEHAHDVTRADQWLRIGEAIAERRSLPAVSAFCRTHYGGILTAAGRWPEADLALTEAVRLWALGHRSLQPGALVRLAELRVRQGRLEEAEQLLDGLDVHVEAAGTLASIHLARGEPRLAVSVIERALAQVEPFSSAAAPLLALSVDGHLATGDVEKAEHAAEQLAAGAARHPSPYPAALAALARARVEVASGTGDPEARLCEALAGFARAELPMELAQARLELARVLVGSRPDVAIVEARAALEAFDRLEAARHADAAAAVLRSLGVRTATARKGDGVLTRREAEVLECLGHGLSNPEISERLFISRKTVEHHVGNILAKLGLRSRAEAAAYTTRTKPAAK
jgi:DNA-binding CsgD family transcriptional regulator